MYCGVAIHLKHEKLEDELMDMRLSVYTENQPGNKCYRKLGFEPVSSWFSRLHNWPVNKQCSDYWYDERKA